MKERTQSFVNAFFERHNDLLPLKEQILEACETLITAFEGGNQLLLCGNGGSCADCKFEKDFKLISDSGKKMRIKRKKLSSCTFYLTD